MAQKAVCIWRWRNLDLSDASVDAVISNYVYHNIMGADQQELLMVGTTEEKTARKIIHKRGATPPAPRFHFDRSIETDCYRTNKSFVIIYIHTGDLM